jgi:hypothetical protein
VQGNRGIATSTVCFLSRSPSGGHFSLSSFSYVVKLRSALRPLYHEETGPLHKWHVCAVEDSGGVYEEGVEVHTLRPQFWAAEQVEGGATGTETASPPSVISATSPCAAAWLASLRQPCEGLSMIRAACSICFFCSGAMRASRRSFFDSFSIAACGAISASIAQSVYGRYRRCQFDFGQLAFLDWSGEGRRKERGLDTHEESRS